MVPPVWGPVLLTLNKSARLCSGSSMCPAGKFCARCWEACRAGITPSFLQGSQWGKEQDTQELFKARVRTGGQGGGELMDVREALFHAPLAAGWARPASWTWPCSERAPSQVTLLCCLHIVQVPGETNGLRLKPLYRPWPSPLPCLAHLL